VPLTWAAEGGQDRDDAAPNQASAAQRFVTNSY
jgi:hypothetical protein